MKKILKITVLAAIALVFVAVILDFRIYGEEDFFEMTVTKPGDTADSVQLTFKEKVRAGIGDNTETVLVPLQTFMGDAAEKRVFYGIKGHKDIARETSLALQTTVKGALIHTTGAEYDDETISRWATESFNADYGTNIEIMIAE